MPLYSFHCPVCKTNFETLAKFEDIPECPSCRAIESERQLSLIAKPAHGEDEACVFAGSPGCDGMGGCGGCAFADHNA